jgi:hypothetical protein
MSIPIKTGWLNDKSGNKFAPKTLMSQVQTSDGVLLEEKLHSDLTALKAEVAVTVDSELNSESTNPVQNKVIDAEFEAMSKAMLALEAELDNLNLDDRYYTEEETRNYVSD